MKRPAILAAAVAAIVLLAASPAAAHTSTTARSGEGVIKITTRICGSSAGWQTVAAENGITAASGYHVGLGQSLSVGCPGGTSATPSSSQAWRTPADMTCFPNYGGRVFGAPRSHGPHKGIDLGPVSGVYNKEPVYAVANGTVIAVGFSGNAGLRVNIRHDDGSVTKSFHLSSESVSLNQRVAKGKQIGYVGDTGNAAVSRGGGGPHLHWETWTGAGAVDPVRFLSQRGIRIAC